MRLICVFLILHTSVLASWNVTTLDNGDIFYINLDLTSGFESMRITRARFQIVFRNTEARDEFLTNVQHVQSPVRQTHENTNLVIIMHYGFTTNWTPIVNQLPLEQQEQQMLLQRLGHRFFVGRGESPCSVSR